MLRVPSGKRISDAPSSSAPTIRPTGSSTLSSGFRSIRTALKTLRIRERRSGCKPVVARRDRPGQPTQCRWQRGPDESEVAIATVVGVVDALLRHRLYAAPYGTDGRDETSDHHHEKRSEAGSEMLHRTGGAIESVRPPFGVLRRRGRSAGGGRSRSNCRLRLRGEDRTAVGAE